MSREKFAHWAEEAREKRDLCLAGELPIEVYVAWLDSDRYYSKKKPITYHDW